MTLVVKMSLAMDSYQQTGNFAGVVHFLRVTVSEAGSRLLVAAHTDLESG